MEKSGRRWEIWNRVSSIFTWPFSCQRLLLVHAEAQNKVDHILRVFDKYLSSPISFFTPY